MPSLKRSKPKTVTDRVKAAGAVAGDAGKAVGNAAQAAGEVVAEGAKTVRDRAVSTTKSTPSGLETTSGKAVAGGWSSGCRSRRSRVLEEVAGRRAGRDRRSGREGADIVRDHRDA